MTILVLQMLHCQIPSMTLSLTMSLTLTMAMTAAALDRVSDYISKSPIQRMFKLSLRHFLELSEVNRACLQGSENFKHPPVNVMI